MRAKYSADPENRNAGMREETSTKLDPVDAAEHAAALGVRLQKVALRFSLAPPVPPRRSHPVTVTTFMGPKGLTGISRRLARNSTRMDASKWGKGSSV